MRLRWLFGRRRVCPASAPVCPEPPELAAVRLQIATSVRAAELKLDRIMAELRKRAANEGDT